MENPEKYLSVKKIDIFPLEYSEDAFRKRLEEFAVDGRSLYIIPKTSEEFRNKENIISKGDNSGDVVRLSLEEGRVVWGKVNAIVRGMNDLSTKDKQIPPIDNIVIVSHSIDSDLEYMVNKKIGATLIISKDFLQKHSIESKVFDSVLAHEVGHHYQTLHNGRKIIEYDLKGHLKEHNPELVNVLEKYNMSGDDLREASLSDKPRQHLLGLLKNKYGLSKEDEAVFTDVASKEDSETGRKSRFIDEHREVLSAFAKWQGVIDHENELKSDRLMGVYSCKNEIGLIDKFEEHLFDKMSMGDKVFMARPSNLRDIATLEQSDTHPNPILRSTELKALKEQCHIPAEELMNLPPPSFPKIPSNGKAIPDSHSH